MKNGICSVALLLTALIGMSACSSKPTAKESKAAAPRDKIQGKTQVMTETSVGDAAMNAGGQSVYILVGMQRYRLFFNTPAEVVPGKEYVAEGVYAQKAIDEIGDPSNGKNGYPLAESCQQVVNMAWSGLALDLGEGHASTLCAKLKRYPARPVFLVTRIQEADTAGSAGKKEPVSEDQDVPEVTIPSEKQSASLVEGPKSLTAPLWQPEGGSATCKVVISTEGKITELETGSQLCEAVPWSQYRYQPPVQRGKPVKVKTEVAVQFEPRK